jgi:hypothetical protein
MKRLALATAAVVPIVTAFACGDPVGKAWLVERPRVLGARVSAESDPGRASIAPRERARVNWLVVGPHGPPRADWTFAACPRPEGNFAEPRCDGPVTTTGSGLADGSGDVAMDFTAIEGEGAMLVLAAFCEGGAAALDPNTFTATCAGGAEALLASTEVRVTTTAPNRNPEIPSDALKLEGAPLDANCMDIPAASGDKTIAYRFGGAEREAITGGTEALVLTHVVTAGALERQYSVLEPTEAAPKEVTIRWTPPGADDVGPEGRSVEMFFVLRDGRGGTAFARRTVCVRRAP